MALIRATVDGKQYEVDHELITSREAKAIRDHTGLELFPFIVAAGSPTSMPVEVVDAWRWLLLTRGGRDASMDDEYPVLRFLQSMEFVDDEPEPDPKASAGTRGTTSKRGGRGSTSGAAATSGD